MGTPPRLKILVISNVFPRPAQPNVGFYIFEQVKRLAAIADIRVVVATPKRLGEAVAPAAVSGIDFQGVKIYETRYPTVPKIGVLFSGYTYYSSVRPLVKLIHREFGFDCIICYWSYPEGAAAVRLGRDYRVPVVIRPRGSDVNLYLKNPLQRLLLAQTLKAADKVIPVSKDLQAKITGLGVDPRQVSSILNGVEIKEFFMDDRLKCRQVLGLPLHHKIVLFVGNLIEIKGVEDLLAAIRILERQGRKDMLFYFLGKGNLSGRIDAVKAGLTNVNLLHGGEVHHRDLYRWLNAADAVCLSSWHEGCPNILLESIACGTPVVATNVGGIPEIVNSPDLGILVPPRSPEQLAAALNAVLEKDWDRAKITARIKNQSWDDVAAKVFNECLDLIK